MRTTTGKGKALTGPPLGPVGGGFLGVPSMRDITQLNAAIDEIRTILLCMMDPAAAKRFRVSWFPRAEDE